MPKRLIYIETKTGTIGTNAEIAPPPSFVRIYRGASGYKLSTTGKNGKPRHLTAGELAWLVSRANGDLFPALSREGKASGIPFQYIS